MDSSCNEDLKESLKVFEIVMHKAGISKHINNDINNKESRGSIVKELQNVDSIILQRT
jgi:hypothetical protein